MRVRFLIFRWVTIDKKYSKRTPCVAIATTTAVILWLLHMALVTLNIHMSIHPYPPYPQQYPLAANVQFPITSNQQQILISPPPPQAAIIQLTE